MCNPPFKSSFFPKHHVSQRHHFPGCLRSFRKHWHHMNHISKWSMKSIKSLNPLTCHYCWGNTSVTREKTELPARYLPISTGSKNLLPIPDWDSGIKNTSKKWDCSKHSDVTPPLPQREALQTYQLFMLFWSIAILPFRPRRVSSLHLNAAVLDKLLYPHLHQTSEKYQ